MLCKVNPLTLQNQRNLSDGIRPRIDVTFLVYTFTSRSEWLTNFLILCISNYKPVNAEAADFFSLPAVGMQKLHMRVEPVWVR